MEMNEVLDQFRPWADLPIDILFSIANRLTLIELLSFRGTCKDFRCASFSASAKNKPGQIPWLIFHKPNSPECLIYNKLDSKSYKRNIQELEGAICLASYQGWLLLFKNESVFFFSPFSLAKITLPNFPHQEIEGHVASFSDIPTSPHCIVSILNRINDSDDFELHVISKGQSVWTHYNVEKGRLRSNVAGATFDHKTQTFHYLDDKKYLLTFSVNEKKWKPFTIVKAEEKFDGPCLPYLYSRTEFFDTIEKKRDEFDLEDDEYVAVCGLTFEKYGCPKVYLNEVVDASPTKNRMRRAVWIQPRFFEAGPNHHW
ncbi:F-box domain-containing protein [Artemisia annua]|uniref:F-box domain-containing protein n=1 Tax=Artemisia annua TaxID=35608 RepID=A0A2U1PFK7_ARTAN|nr:F-box domain-containing protein [Artemisia annua]